MDEPPLFASEPTEPLAPTSRSRRRRRRRPRDRCRPNRDPPVRGPSNPRSTSRHRRAPLAWSGEASPDRSVPGSAAEPPVRWEVPPDRGGIAVPGAPDLIYAGTVARLVAFILDSFILGVVGIVVAVLIVGVLGRGSLATAVAATGLVLLELVYFVVLWTGRPAGDLRDAPAQAPDRERDGRPDGDPRAGGQALAGLRAVALPAGRSSRPWPTSGTSWPCLERRLLVSVALNAIHQGLHDKFAGTAIVQPRGSSNGLLVGCVVIVAVFGLITFVGIVALIFLGSQISEIQTTP